MSDNIIINNRKLTISIKTVRINGRTYSYYNTKVTLGKDPVTGKQKQRDFTGRTKEELIENLEKELGKPVLPPESSTLLSTWLDTWMNTYAEMNLKPTTKANYQTGIELAIKPGIGDMPIRDLDEYNISRFYKNLDEQGKAPILSD